MEEKYASDCGSRQRKGNRQWHKKVEKNLPMSKGKGAEQWPSEARKDNVRST